MEFEKPPIKFKDKVYKNWFHEKFNKFVNVEKELEKLWNKINTDLWSKSYEAREARFDKLLKDEAQLLADMKQILDAGTEVIENDK